MTQSVIDTYLPAIGSSYQKRLSRFADKFSRPFFLLIPVVNLSVRLFQVFYAFFDRRTEADNDIERRFGTNKRT